MLSAHVGVMSAAAFGDLPTVTTVGRSVGIFTQNNDFCSKCWFPKMKGILETSRILRKPASINSDPGSHCQPSSWMTWADCRVVSYNLFDHVDSNFRTIICFHIGWQGPKVYLSNDTDNPDLTISSATQNSLNENKYRAKSLSRSLLFFEADILMSCKWQHCISEQMCLSISILIDALSSAQCPHSMKTFISELFCGQNFWSVATTVHLYYLPLLYITFPWNVFQTNIPWLINICYQTKIVLHQFL